MGAAMKIKKSLLLLICLSILITSACNKTPNITPGFSPSPATKTTVIPNASPTSIPAENPAALINIEIGDKSPYIYAEMSLASPSLARCYEGDVLNILETSVDNKGKTWYKVQYRIDAIGWVEGDFCKKTSKAVTVQFQAIGKLIDPEIDKDILLELLEIENSTLEAMIKKFGKNFKKTIDQNDDGSFTIIYTYPNGLNFQSYRDETIDRVWYGDKYYGNCDFKKIIANVSPLPGKEILYLIDSNKLLIIQQDTDKILGNYIFNTPYIEDIVALDYLNTGNDQIFISRDFHFWEPSYNGLYKLSTNNALIEVFDTNDFAKLSNNITPSIDDKRLTLDIKIDDYEFNKSNNLPESIFYNRKKFKTHNEALSKYIDLQIQLIDNKYYIVADIYVVFDVLEAYFGLPDPESDENPPGWNFLSRTRLILYLTNNEFKLKNAETNLKYDIQSSKTLKLLKGEELKMQNGVELHQNFDEAVKMINEKPEIPLDKMTATYKGFKIHKDGTYLTDVSEIEVFDPKYTTSRGIKVGDPESKVIELYGAPNQEFQGDKNASYHCYFDSEGDVVFSRFWGIDFKYENGKVVSYRMYFYELD